MNKIILKVVINLTAFFYKVFIRLVKFTTLHPYILKFSSQKVYKVISFL
jgi:hypothetical protein